MLEFFVKHYAHVCLTALIAIGFFGMVAKRNLVKKLIGLNIFQTSVFVLYISMGKILGGTAPILIEGRDDVVYSNPIPHVLILTAIVVGVAGLLEPRVPEELLAVSEDLERA